MKLRKQNMLLSALTAFCFTHLAMADDIGGSGKAPVTIAANSTARALKNKAGHRPSSAEIQKHIYDRSVVLSYDDGQYELTQLQKNRLLDLINNAGGAGVIDELEVAAWSDKPFPMNGKDLPSVDIELADKRAEKVKDYVKGNLSVSSVQAFNMAETSNWLARAFRTDDAEIKSVFSRQASAPMAREDFNVISQEGSPSKVVIIAVLKSTQATE